MCTSTRKFLTLGKTRDEGESVGVHPSKSIVPMPSPFFSHHFFKEGALFSPFPSDSSLEHCVVISLSTGIANFNRFSSAADSYCARDTCAPPSYPWQWHPPPTPVSQ